MAQTVAFVTLVSSRLTLTFELCSIFLSFVLGMKYWNLHAKFHITRSGINIYYHIMGDMPWTDLGRGD